MQVFPQRRSFPHMQDHIQKHDDLRDACFMFMSTVSCHSACVCWVCNHGINADYMLFVFCCSNSLAVVLFGHKTTDYYSHSFYFPFMFCQNWSFQAACSLLPWGTAFLSFAIYGVLSGVKCFTVYILFIKRKWWEVWRVVYKICLLSLKKAAAPVVSDFFKCS